MIDSPKPKPGRRNSEVKVTRIDGSVEVQGPYNRYQLKDINAAKTKAVVDMKHETREQLRRKRLAVRIRWKQIANGTWVVVGPVKVLKVDKMVKVSARPGFPTRIRIRSIGKEFKRNGVRMAYGYPSPNDLPASMK